MIPLLTAWDWTAFNTALAASACAVIFGIPFALWINREVERRQQKGEHERNRGRQEALLRSLRNEIKHNYELIDYVKTEFEADPMRVPLFPVNTDLWSALAAELATATISVHLIGAISALYFDFRCLERKLDALYSLNMRPSAMRLPATRRAVSSQANQMREKIIENLLEDIPGLEEFADTVLMNLDYELSGSGAAA